jgi:hypothetical protein
LEAIALASLLYLFVAIRPATTASTSPATATPASRAGNTIASNVVAVEPGTTSSLKTPAATANQTGTNPVTYFVESGLPTQAHFWNVTYNNISNASGSGLSQAWIATKPYPTGIDDHSCISYAGYVYCIGGSLGLKRGATNSSYYAVIYPDGALGNWTATDSYPIAVYDLSCNVYGDYVYCVGGANSAGTSQSAVYYAPILSPGIGAWISTTPYPTAIHNQACRIFGGYIYCIGGNNGGGETDQACYAPIIASNAVGSWAATTSYPLNVEDQACEVSNGYIYCVGGWTPGGSSTANTYFASLSSMGIGAWTPSTPYPTNTSDHKTCSISNNYFDCAGGFTVEPNVVNSTYYAPASYNGLGTWLQGQDYPGAWRSMSATSYNGHLYYVGGYRDTGAVITNGVYYTRINNMDTISFSTEPETYAYTIANQVVNGTTYTPSPASGTFAAGGTLQVTFSSS